MLLELLAWKDQRIDELEQEILKLKGETLKPKRDLSEVIGSLSKKEAETIDDEVARQRSIAPELWR